MKSEFEFGKATREMNLARRRIAAKRTRNFLTIAALLAVVVVIISFRTEIKTAFEAASSQDSDKETVKGKKQKEQESPASPGIHVSERKELPAELLEISGLAYIDEQRFAAVQDEKGSVFIYNAKGNAIEKEIPFGAAGDYEGLALADGAAWVLRSDGTLFEVNMNSGNNQPAKEYDTPLSAADNAEGLCYDPKNKRLLVALKEGNAGNYKGIYAFDLATKQMQAAPVYRIDLNNELLAGKKSKKKGDAFMPSGIVIHPVTGDMYITEGRDAKLLITDGAGTIKKLYHLDKKDFVQPEGITFSPAGELYIANEGKKERGTILKVGIGKE